LGGKRFEDCWKPSLREHVIETSKKKRK
jgi:hypothetical protein